MTPVSVTVVYKLPDGTFRAKTEAAGLTHETRQFEAISDLFAACSEAVAQHVNRKMPEGTEPVEVPGVVLGQGVP